MDREGSGSLFGEMGVVRGPPGGLGGVGRPSQIEGRGQEGRERMGGSPRGWEGFGGLSGGP